MFQLPRLIYGKIFLYNIIGRNSNTAYLCDNINSDFNKLKPILIKLNIGISMN